MTNLPKLGRVEIALDALALVCLAIMFLAGNDIWHDAGRPDFWHLREPPFPDVRVFVVAYYAVVILTLGRLLVRLGGLARRKKLPSAMP